MNFFQHFPTVQYVFDGDTLPIVNITARVKIIEKLKQHVAVLYDYVIQDGDRPDTVSTQLYGTPNYTWVILVANNIHSLYDWPLTTDEFEYYIVAKYGSREAAQASFLYRTAAGDFVDATTYNLMDASLRGTPLSHYDDELTKNENKRRIKIVPQEYVEALALELRQVMTQ